MRNGYELLSRQLERNLMERTFLHPSRAVCVAIFIYLIELSHIIFDSVRRKATKLYFPNNFAIISVVDGLKPIVKK